MKIEAAEVSDPLLGSLQRLEPEIVEGLLMIVLGINEIIPPASFLAFAHVPAACKAHPFCLGLSPGEPKLPQLEQILLLEPVCPLVVSTQGGCSHVLLDSIRLRGPGHGRKRRGWAFLEDNR